MISPEALIVATKNQISTDVSDETVILNLENGVYYGLDPVGTFIWKLIQIPTNINNICAALMSEYNVERALVERDVLNLLGELSEQGLIEVKDSSIA